MGCAKGADGRPAIGTPCREAQDAALNAGKAIVAGNVKGAAQNIAAFGSALTDKAKMTFKAGKIVIAAINVGRRDND
jgi:hypothetical protein